MKLKICVNFLMLLFFLNLVQAAVKLDDIGERYLFLDDPDYDPGRIVAAELFGVTSGDAKEYPLGTEIIYQANTFSMTPGPLQCSSDGKRSYAFLTAKPVIKIKKESGSSLRLLDPFAYVNEEISDIDPVLEFGLDTLWEFLSSLAELSVPSPFGLIFDESIDQERSSEEVIFDFPDYQLMGAEWNWYIHKNDNGEVDPGKFLIKVENLGTLIVNKDSGFPICSKVMPNEIKDKRLKEISLNITKLKNYDVGIELNANFKIK